MQTWLHAFEQTLRRLRRNPAFALTAVVTLALGIGANTAMFTVVHDVLLKPLRYAEPQQLVTIREGITAGGTRYPDLPVNANHLLFWQRHNHSFTGIAALLPTSMPLGGGQPEEIAVLQQTANLFSVLGVEPKLGRAFTATEEQPGHNVVILSESLWKRRFGSDTSILGRTIALDGRPYEVVGVLPGSFALPSARAVGELRGTDKPIEAFVPFGWTAEQLSEVEGDHNYFTIGRLRPGVTAAAAAAEIDTEERLLSAQMQNKMVLSATVIPFQEYLVGASRSSLLLLLAAVGAVLLIACVNITNLMLARAAGRGHEAAVRSALGATRGRLLRTAMAEPLMIAATGCALGLGLAAAALPALLARMPNQLPRMNEVHIGGYAVVFAVGISLAVAVVCGILPAWRFAAGEPQLALRSETRTSSESRSGKRLRRMLVGGEVAASVALVILAGLLILSFFRLLHVDRGFQSNRVIAAEVVLPDKPYSDVAVRNAFYEQALDRLRHLPGVESAGAVSVLPLDGDNWGDLIARVGDNRSLWEKPGAHYRWITPGYFESLHVPLVAGRLLSDSDRGRNVAVLSKDAADAAWPGQDAVGQQFRRGDPDEPPMTVIGVVANVRSVDLAETPPRMVYVPYWYRSREIGSLVIRTPEDPSAMAAAIRRTIWSLDAQIPIPQVRTMETVVNGSVAARRFQMLLLFTFAASALLLAALGIYGVVAYTAQQRTQEIGIRTALGAGTRDVYRLILLEGITPVLGGTLVGIAVAMACGRLISSLLFHVQPYDAIVTLVSSGILVAVGVLACLLPAWRATRIDPVQALRYQ